MSAPPTRVRSFILVERPAFTDRRAETWHVTVTERPRASGYKSLFDVIATFVAEHVPRQYDTAAKAWIEPHDVKIPGFCIPPEPDVFEQLAAARARARRLADVLDGRLHPAWKETET